MGNWAFFIIESIIGVILIGFLGAIIGYGYGLYNLGLVGGLISKISNLAVCIYICTTLLNLLFADSYLNTYLRMILAIIVGCIVGVILHICSESKLYHAGWGLIQGAIPSLFLMFDAIYMNFVIAYDCIEGRELTNALIVSCAGRAVLITIILSVIIGIIIYIKDYRIGK